MWAGVPAEMEVFNLFSGLVRQEGLSRMERAKQRQSLVPDLRISIQPQAVVDAEVSRDLRVRRAAGAARGGGGVVEGGVLHEVKIIEDYDRMIRIILLTTISCTISCPSFLPQFSIQCEKYSRQEL